MLARALVPGMVTNGRGHLCVIGSTGTDDWPEGMTAYLAGKYALRGLFLGWQQELRGTGVRATLIAPGATLTRSWEGQEPPPAILDPHAVATRVYRAVVEGEEGRIVLRPGDEGIG